MSDTFVRTVTFAAMVEPTDKGSVVQIGALGRSYKIGCPTRNFDCSSEGSRAGLSSIPQHFFFRSP
jgi:hypothetical protein